MPPPIVYLRKEKTVCKHTLSQAAPLAPSQRDVVAYDDPEAKILVGRWPWHWKSKPTRRARAVFLNCYKRPVEWLPDAS